MASRARPTYPEARIVGLFSFVKDKEGTENVCAASSHWQTAARLYACRRCGRRPSFCCVTGRGKSRSMSVPARISGSPSSLTPSPELSASGPLRVRPVKARRRAPEGARRFQAARARVARADRSRSGNPRDPSMLLREGQSRWRDPQNLIVRRREPWSNTSRQSASWTFFRVS